MNEHITEYPFITVSHHNGLSREVLNKDEVLSITSVQYAFADSHHPYEDSSYVGSLPVFIVADGVSRTNLNDGSYPDPSGAALAASRFTQVAGQYLEEHYRLFFPDVLLQAFQQGNDSIAELNESYGIRNKLDYSVNDYFNTCAAAGVIVDNNLHYSTIGDCQIALFDRYDNLILLTKNEVEPLEYLRDGKTFPTKDERMIYWRRHLRNHPRAGYATYGTLTGEIDAEEYLQEGSIPLQRGDRIYIFSDGFYNFALNEHFRNFINNGPTLQELRSFINILIKNNQVKAPSDDRTLIAAFIS